ncbi:MAG: glycosyltransferase family 39 protein [Polyangiaceae bacterium]
MKARAPLVDRIALAIVVVATAWFAFTAAWGMFGIPGGGHLGGGNAGTLMAAEQIVRWKILYPARAWYSDVQPEGTTLMCHHPYGQYYVPALLYFLFGHRDVLVHLPAVVLSTAIPPLLYGIAKERLGAPLGAVAAAAYVVVPIAVGFSTYWNLETICIFGTLLFFWGHSRHMATSRTRYLAASLFGLCVVCSGDWIGYVLVAPTLAWAFMRAFLLPARATPRFKLQPYARWWAMSVVIMVVQLVFWVGLFQHVDQISQWLGAAEYRGGGKVATLAETLHARRGWIEFSFTPLAIALGKVAAPVCLLRLLVSRRDEETYAPGLLFGAVVQYVTFKKGADVHTFWPHYFAPYFALALAELVGSVVSVVTAVVRHFSRFRVQFAAGVGLAIGLVPALAMAHDGVKSLWVWRRTGGRYDDNGALIRSHVDLLYVLRQVVLPQTTRGTSIDAHPSAQWGWEFLWTYQGVANAAAAPVVGAADVARHPFWIARGSGLSADEQRKISATAHVKVFGDAWIVDQRERPEPLDAYTLSEREPNAFEWLLYGGTEPVRSISSAPDVLRTWEWRTHLGQPVALPSVSLSSDGSDSPGGEDLEEMRLVHNVAVAKGDDAAADRWRSRISQSLDRSVATSFTEGVELMGMRMMGGVQPRAELWFTLKGDVPPGDASFNVRSTVESRESFSLIPPDPTDREMAFPPTLPTKLWRPNFIYETEVVLNHRIGRERYWGYWRSRDGSRPPARLDGQPQTKLVVVE